MQKQCIADTVSAIWLCDWSSFQSKALATLVGSIEQHLPKAKREACLRECKQAKLSHHRKMKGAQGVPMDSLMDMLPAHLLVSVLFLVLLQEKRGYAKGFGGTSKRRGILRDWMVVLWAESIKDSQYFDMSGCRN